MKRYEILTVQIMSLLDQRELAPDKTMRRGRFIPIPKCEEIIKNMPNPPKIKHTGVCGFYDPTEDQVYLPRPTSFGKRERYYAALFHELIHSTGHKKRLNRKRGNWQKFGSKDYCHEELIAELGACFLCAECNIEQAILEESAAYIKTWLKRLENGEKAIILAIPQAVQAVNYIVRKEV